MTVQKVRTSEAGEIDKGKGDSITQEEELKKGKVGYKKSSDSSSTKRAGEGTYVTLTNGRE